MRLARPLIALLAASLLPAAAPPTPHWTGSWASAQQVPEERNTLPPADLTDMTLRQIVHLSIGGSLLRVRVSNAFGIAPLRIDAAHVARAATPGSAAIVPGSDRVLTFNGQPDVIVPAGAEYSSDPVALDAPPLSSLAVSHHLPAPPTRQTSHPGSRATSYLVPGVHVGDPDLPGARTIEHWFALSGIEVAGAARNAIVALGDSITDGHAATTNGDDRWPDDLARRLQSSPATRGIAVLNQGIGGNRLLEDGLGPNALARFDRDVLAQAGARWVIVLEGINDLGNLTRERPASAEDHAAFVRAMIGAYAQMIERAHAHGIKIIGGTVMPDGGSDYYHPDAANEADRQTVNRWIRAPGHFDAVIDFDAVMRDPALPGRLLPRFDGGDHLHPSPTGYAAMAAAIPLALFRP
jgi:lysophospholipase L1-like esterase